MSRQTNAATWVPLSTVDRLVAIDKMARTRDGQQGTIRYFIGRCVVLGTNRGREVTVPVVECEVLA
jgi:hypothetical protein